MKLIDYFFSKPIIITDAITKKVRCRTHSKWRIDKKWRKRYGYKEVIDHSAILVINDTLYMTQKMYDRLQEELARVGGNDHEQNYQGNT